MCDSATTYEERARPFGLLLPRAIPPAVSDTRCSARPAAAAADPHDADNQNEDGGYDFARPACCADSTYAVAHLAPPVPPCCVRGFSFVNSVVSFCTSSTREHPHIGLVLESCPEPGNLARCLFVRFLPCVGCTVAPARHMGIHLGSSVVEHQPGFKSCFH